MNRSNLALQGSIPRFLYPVKIIIKKIKGKDLMNFSFSYMLRHFKPAPAFTLVPIIIFSLFGNFLFAQTATTFETANSAYKNGDYTTAIREYESILAKGEEAQALYYNLANSYYKENKLGKAILNYERALLLDPNEEQALFNLALAKRKVKGEIDPVPPFFLRSWWNKTRSALGPTLWGIIALLTFWGAIAGLSFWQIGKDKTQKKKGFALGLSLLLLTILPLSLAWSAYQHQRNSNEGVLIATSASLKTGADENSKETRIIHEGTKLEILDQINVWHKVRLENGETGWLPAGSFEEI